jgi:hypothetical protein
MANDIYIKISDLIYGTKAGARTNATANNAVPTPNPDQTNLFFFLCATST